MNLNKGDSYILNNLSSHKAISVVLMISGALGIIFGGYLIIFKGEKGLNVALTGASLVVLGSSFLSFCYLKLLEQFKKGIDNPMHQATGACPKCSYEFTIKEKITNDASSISPKDSNKKRSHFSFLLELPFLIAVLGCLTGFLLWLFLGR